MSKEDRTSQKFNIGASEKDIKKFQEPRWQHEVPDIRMQLTPEDILDRLRQEGLGSQESERRDYREQDPYFGLNRNFQRIVRGLDKLYKKAQTAKEKPVEKGGEEKETQEQQETEVKTEADKEREKFPVLYEQLMVNNLLEINQELDDEYLRLRNPVPFDTRQGDYYFSNMQKAVKVALLEEEWAKPDSEENPLTPERIETRFWLYSTHEDVLWQSSLRRLLKGQAGGLDKFFDWGLVLEQVKERYREDPPSNLYELTFKKHFRGPSLPEVEIKGEKEKVEEREQGVKYNSEYRYWSMAVASVHQMDHDSEGKEVLSMKNLTEQEKKFVQLMFGMGKNGEWEEYAEDDWAEFKGQDYPHNILNWPAMKSTQINRERYVAIMSEMLTGEVRDELKKKDYKDLSNIELLVKEIKNRVEKRRVEWYTPDLSHDQLLADVVVKSGIIFDIGHKSMIDLGWGFRYDDKGGREFIAGGTTVQADTSTGVWWREFKRKNAFEKGWSSSVLPDMSPEYVQMLLDKPPNHKPTLEDLSDNADLTDEEKEMGHLWRAPVWRLQNRIQEANPDLWPYLQEQVWYWESSYKTKDGKNLVLPMWMPPSLESVNYWNTIAWDPKEEIKDELGEVELEEGEEPPDKRTVWEALLDGEDISIKDWGEVEGSLLDDQSYYKHLITINQAKRILSIINMKPEIAKQEFATFFEEAAMIDELRKRADLGVRDEKSPIAVINMSLVPLLIVAATARKRGIFSEAGASKVMLGKWLAGDLEEWRRVIIDTTPEEREGIEGYRDGMLAFFDYYTTQLVLAANLTGLEREGDEEKHTNHLIDIIKADTKVVVEFISPLDEKESRAQ